MKTIKTNHADDSWGLHYLRNFYPAGASEIREPPEGCTDAVHVDVTIQFGVWDRLKLALGFDVMVRLVTWTEKRPGYVQTDPPVVKVFWPWRRRRPDIGVVAAAEQEKTGESSGEPCPGQPGDSPPARPDIVT